MVGVPQSELEIATAHSRQQQQSVMTRLLPPSRLHEKHALSHIRLDDFRAVCSWEKRWFPVLDFSAAVVRGGNRETTSLREGLEEVFSNPAVFGGGSFFESLFVIQPNIGGTRFLPPSREHRQGLEKGSRRFMLHADGR